jgi:biopolymer transport protein ExbD
MATGGSRGVKNEINVTPLVDVVLVLLIIFMVVTPMLQRGKDVNLPKAKNPTEEKKADEPLIISVTPDKQIYFDKEQVDEENLQRLLANEIDKAPGRVILLKGDSSLQFGDVKKVMLVASKAKADRISLGVEEEKTK